MPQTPPSTTGTTQPQAPPTTATLVPGCPEEGQFTEGGHVGRIDQGLSDATTIGTISWEETDACETFTISFETSEGAPATTPPTVIVDYLEPAPIIRIRLEVDTTVVTDQLVETTLVDRLYVVSSLEGNMFIDLHLAAPAQSRVDIDTSPAAVRIDLQPGIVEFARQPATSKLTVVTSPLDGATVEPTTAITGYTRTFEANVIVIGTADGQVVARANTTAADSIGTWGEFRTEIDLEPGDVSLFVGDESPQDGSLEGVTLGVTVR